MKNKFIAILFIAMLAACGGPKTTQIQGMDLSIDLPSGWKIGNDTYGGVYTIEVSNAGKLRALKITEPAVKVESLDMLVEGAKDFQILGKETIPLGFGITLKADGQKQFLYYINKGGKQYKCEPGPYYKESDCDKVIEVIKTIK